MRRRSPASSFGSASGARCSSAWGRRPPPRVGARGVGGAAAPPALGGGGRGDEAVTPILLMPTVGGFFVGTIAAVQVAGPSLGVLFFGAGLISWLTMESVVLHRLLNRTLSPELRATLGIHLTPPAIACVAYLELGDASPDRFVQCVFGYALLQGAVMLRLVPWLREQPFSHRAWAHTFGIAALPLAALRLAELGQEGPIPILALPLFIGANLAIGWIALRSILLMVGRS
jgi:tellurite resistance protein